MVETQDGASGRWSARRKRLVVVAAVAAVIVLVPSARLLVLLARGWGGRAEVERQLDRIRSEGGPAAFEDLAPPPVPLEDNAAQGLLRAFELLDANRASEPEGWEKCLEGPFEPHLAEVGTLLDLHAGALEIARDALGRPHCRFDLDYAARTGMEFPHFADVRHLARLFAAGALLEAHAGRPGEAARDLECIFGLSRATEAHPLLIVKLIGVTVAGHGINALKEVERAAPLPADARRRLADLLGRFDFPAQFAHAMLGERLLAREILRRSRQKLPSWHRPIARRLQLPDEAKLLEFMTGLVGASRLSFREFRSSLESARAGLPDEGYPHFSIVAGLILPALEQAHLGHFETEARIRLARLGIALEVHRSIHGEYPGSPDALFHEFPDGLPRDPFTDGLFIYRKTGDEGSPDGRGFVVYSVGPNLADDAGVSDPDAGKDDIAWEQEPREEETGTRPVETGAGRDGPGRGLTRPPPERTLSW